MSVDSKHPLYSEALPDFVQMRDTHAGQRRVKQAGQRYLPATEAMLRRGAETGRSNSRGFRAYQRYLTRAEFPEIVSSAVESMLGVMHHKPPTIELPPQLEPLRERATLRNESLEMLLRRINEEQLVAGRLGLFLEPLPGADPRPPMVAVYNAEAIGNWDDGDRDDTEVSQLNYVSLEESEYERTTSFEWEFRRKYRVLVLGDIEENEMEQAGSVYRFGVFREDSTLEFSESQLVTPTYRGRSLEEIPFVFVNTKDVCPEPDRPVLIGLSNLALTIYRADADYRQAIFRQGQDTLILIGRSNPDEEVEVGAAAKIDLPVGGDAKYVGVDSQGIPEMRSSIENDRQRAGRMAGELIEDVGRQAESGRALRIRVSARTATLNQIAHTGAFALQEILRKNARWIGADPEAVVVQPNLDFVADELEGRSLVEWVTARTMGLPFSRRSMHERMQERGLTTLSYEEEVEEIESEDQDDDQGSTDPDGPVQDEDLDDDGSEEDATE